MGCGVAVRSGRAPERNGFSAASKPFSELLSYKLNLLVFSYITVNLSARARAPMRYGTLCDAKFYDNINHLFHFPAILAAGAAKL